MMHRMSVLVLWTAVAGVLAPAVIRFGDGQLPVVHRSPPAHASPVAGASVHQNRVHHPYGKIELPAELSISLGQGDGAGDPITIVVAASSLVPIDSGVLTLMVPGVGAEPNHAEILWAGTPADFVSETAMYETGALSLGHYCFTVAFEFMPQGDDADRVAISQSLYLDVRDTGILSSNVSFEQIRRLELRRELERRILATYRPGLNIASERDVTDELDHLEAADPGFLDRQIADLKANDPDVARRIMQLNESSAVIAEQTSHAVPQPEQTSEKRAVSGEYEWSDGEQQSTPD